jgi:dihydropteroate synthase
MKLLFLDGLDEKELLLEIDRIGADRRSFPYFRAKDETLLLAAKDLDVRAANALKQEMLSRGGDVIVHKRTIDCGVTHTDAILMGTPGQFSRLLEKLDSMPYWGLPEFQAALSTALRNLRRRAWNIPLPGGRTLSLGDQTRIMGILNVTGDSFFAGSRHLDPGDAVRRALSQLEEGADLVDIGGESTRPGAPDISPEEESARVVPVISEIRRLRPQSILSIDTRKASVAEAAVKAGADIVNDVSGLRYDPEMTRTLSELRVPVILMHSRKTPGTMQESPAYSNAVSEVWEELEQVLENAVRAGIDKEAVILDPGLGFAKNAEHNLSLLKHIRAFRTLGRPLLVGHSRKSTIGQVLSLPSPEDRLEGTLAITALCAWQGIPLVRVHDVRENYRVSKMIEAIRKAS